MDLSLTNLSSQISADFAKTEIITNGPAIADGLSELTVAVQLKNSDNSPVADYRPEYEVVSGSGVIKNDCTKSLNNGLSYCLLKATIGGLKRIRLTNAKVGLESMLQFTSKVSTPRSGLAARTSTLETATATGLKGSFSVGLQTGKVLTSTGGYKLNLTTKAVLQ
jgi:hypothetical protein